MIFKDKLCQKVLDGTKTQTRRLMKDGEYVFVKPTGEVVEVCDSNNRLKWHVGNSYAVQPGRGKHAVGRILLKGIRRESVQSISEADAIAEGVSKLYYRLSQWQPNEATLSFKQLWNNIHPKGKRWEDNPDVWVLDFELVKP